MADRGWRRVAPNVAAGTLILSDEDRRAGRGREVDLAVLLRVGAGNGQQRHAAAVRYDR